MFMKGSFQMNFIMVMGPYQRLKGNMKENLKRENNMGMDNLDGKIVQFIEDTTIWEFEKDRENTFQGNLQVFQEEYGRMES